MRVEVTLPLNGGLIVFEPAALAQLAEQVVGVPVCLNPTGTAKVVDKLGTVVDARVEDDTVVAGLEVELPLEVAEGLDDGSLGYGINAIADKVRRGELPRQKIVESLRRMSSVDVVLKPKPPA